MTKTSFKVGDKLTWKRNGDRLTCYVREIDDTHLYKQRGKLRVEGWLGTHWETLDDGHFELNLA